MKGVLAFIIGILLSPIAASQTDSECLRYAVYREARGEPVRAMRAVYDVLQNRMHKFKLSACSVLKQKGQFPYMRKGKVKIVVDKAFSMAYNSVLKMESVLTREYIYFNHHKHPWGKHTRKIGKLYFSQ